MDVTRRRAKSGGGGLVAAGSVWETRMKSDEVKGGIKVFNGEERSNNNDSKNLDENQNVDDKKVILKRGQAKRKTWKSESFEGPIQIAKGKSLDGECKSPVLGKKSCTIQNKKTRSELVKSKSEPINGGEKSSSPSSLQLRKVKSQPQPQPQPETQPSKNSDEEKEDDKNEEIPVERSEEEQEEVEVAEEFQDKAISGEVKNVTVSKSPPQTFPDVEMEDGVEEDEADETEEIDEEDEEEFEEVTEADDEIQKKRVDIKEINVEELKPPSVLVINQFPTSPDFKKSSPGSDAEECINFPQTHNKLQNLVDLVMWRDVPKSALIFGMGSFIIISSSYTTDLNISFISVVSYLGLVYLAAIFLYRSIICRGYINIEDDSSYVVGQEEAIWLVKLFLPYLNEFLLKLKALFSGDPATTMKLAVLLFVLARCGNSITIWKMAKLGFFGVFIVPKVCSSYSTQLAAYGKFWIRRFRDAWDSCSHKKAVAGAIFTLVWNLSSMVARIWAVFVLFVAFRYYQQSMVRDEWVEDDTTVGEETCNGPQIKQQKEVCKPNNNGQKPINARYKPNNEVNRPLRGWRRPTIAQTNKAKKAS